MVPEMGSGHRAGGADLASGVDAAGTVARIDLRLPHHPVCEVASADSDASARITLRLAPTRDLFLDKTSQSTYLLFDLVREYSICPHITGRFFKLSTF